MLELERKVRAELLRRFVATGASASIETLAGTLQVGTGDVRGALRGLSAQHLIALEPKTDEPWMLHPFSAAPTDYSVEAAGVLYWANCAWDALSIPCLIGRPATLRGVWSDTGDRLELHVSASGPRPNVGFVRFNVPPRALWDDIAYS